MSYTSPPIRDWASVAALMEQVGPKEAGRQLGLSRSAVKSGVARFKRREEGAATGPLAEPRSPASGAGISCNEVETRLVVPDRHGFAMHPDWWRALLAVARELRPDKVITMGDWCDMVSLSHHPKRTPNITRFEDEIEEGKRRYGELQEAARPKEMYALEGNHEGWASGFMAEQPNLAGTLDIPKRTGLAETGIRWVSLTEQDDFRLGPVGYCHGISESRHSAKAHAEDFAPVVGVRFITFAHVHTFQTFTSKAGFMARCCGFGGDEKNSAFGYKKGRPAGWKLGFKIEEVCGQSVTDTDVYVIDGRAVFRGAVY